MTSQESRIEEKTASHAEALDQIGAELAELLSAADMDRAQMSALVGEVLDMLGV